MEHLSCYQNVIFTLKNIYILSNLSNYVLIQIYEKETLLQRVNNILSLSASPDLNVYILECAYISVGMVLILLVLLSAITSLTVSKNAGNVLWKHDNNLREIVLKGYGSDDKSANKEPKEPINEVPLGISVSLETASSSEDKDSSSSD